MNPTEKLISKDLLSDLTFFVGDRLFSLDFIADPLPSLHQQQPEVNVFIFAERGSQTSQHDEDDHAGPTAEDDGATHDGPQP